MILSDEDIRMMAEHYGITIDPNDAYHYKLCLVIYQLEERLLKAGEDPRSKPKKE